MGAAHFACAHNTNSDFVHKNLQRSWLMDDLNKDFQAGQESQRGMYFDNHLDIK
jgi:hypothetical protein